jgi:hypothetical protein
VGVAVLIREPGSSVLGRLPFGECREDAGQVVRAWVEASLLAGHFFEGDVVGFVPLEADHDTGGFVGEGVDGGGAQAGGEDAVEGRRGAA